MSNNVKLPLGVYHITCQLVFTPSKTGINISLVGNNDQNLIRNIINVNDV